MKTLLIATLRLSALADSSDRLIHVHISGDRREFRTSTPADFYLSPVEARFFASRLSGAAEEIEAVEIVVNPRPSGKPGQLE